jgi:hypothetical protein
VARNGIYIKGFLVILGTASIGMLPAPIAGAANPEPVTVDMNFIDPITITENNPLRFGLLDVNMANGNRVRIGPDGTVVDNQNRILGGTQAPADLTVTATASQSITILVDNVTTATGYSLARFRCIYNNGTDTRCDGNGYSETTVASATLKIGVRLTGNGNAVLGVDNSNFDVTITYQ